MRSQNKKINFFEKDINFLSLQEKKLIFLIYIILTLALSVLFCIYFLRQFPEFFYEDSFDINIIKIPFGFGNLLNNIFENKQYMNSELFKLHHDGVFIEDLNINFVLKKLPFYTYLLFLLLSISENIFFLIIIKNLIFFNIFYFTAYFSLRSLNMKISSFLIIIIFFLFVPYNFKTFSEISFADSVTSILLGCLFLVSISKMKSKFFLIGIYLFILYLTKESMFGICVVLPILVVLFEFKNYKYRSFIPILFVLISIMCWGTFGLYKTGVFPFGSSLSTWKSYDMSKAFDEKFADYYPKYSTDFIDTNVIDKKISNEWEFYNYYKEKNINKLMEKFDLVFKNIILKIKFILFNIKPDGYQFETNINSDNLFILSSILNKFVFYLSIMILIYVFISKKYSKNFMELYYFSLVCLNIAPHTIGWATSKHLIGIYLIAFIFIILYLQNNFSLRNKEFVE